MTGRHREDALAPNACAARVSRRSKFCEHPALGHRLVTSARIVPDTAKLRQTSLADAAADVFTAAEATGPFKGTYSSSFSDAVSPARHGARPETRARARAPHPHAPPRRALALCTVQVLRLRTLNGRRHALDEHTLTDAQMQMGVTLHTPGGHLAHSPGQPMESHDGPQARLT
jgi:hypothetical protein